LGTAPQAAGPEAQPLAGVRGAIAVAAADEAEMLGRYLVAAGAELLPAGAPGAQIVLEDPPAGPERERGGLVARRAGAPAEQALQLCHPLRRATLIEELATLARGRALVSPAAAVATLLQEQAKAPRSSARILVAEDHPTNQYVVRRQLDTLGYEAEIAGDGVQALQMLEAGAFALLLADMHMPNMDGLELAREIRRREASGAWRGHLPIVALTANALRGESERCLAAGMDGYLSKPVTIAELKGELLRRLPPPAPSPKTLELDPSQLGEGLAARPDAKVLAILEEFEQSTRQSMERLEQSVREMDEPEVRRLAHNIQVSSRAVAAVPLAEAADALEQAAQRHESGDFPLLLQRARDHMARVKRAIVHLRGEISRKTER
jgi:two-component system, sensor histidine kinase and response regulator